MRNLVRTALVIAVSFGCGDDDVTEEGACSICLAEAECDEGADKPCTCPAGFAGDGTNAGTGCVDVDECAESTDDCVDGLASCENRAGGFACTCIEGYSGDGRASGTGCSDVDECATGTDDCVGGLSRCNDTDGGFTCTCVEGYSGDGRASGTGCSDIDECAAGSDTCGALDCVNRMGGFACAGWLLPGRTDGFVDRRSADLEILDGLPVVLATPEGGRGPAAGLNGMAQDPTTGIVYVIVRPAAEGLPAQPLQGPPPTVLATFDISTGVATRVGDMGQNFASLAFDATGQLWGVTQDADIQPETLFRVDKATGSATMALPLGGGDAGECIAYQPDENRLYHWSGHASPVVESIDLGAVALEATQIAASGTTSGEVSGCLWDATREAFLVWEVDSTVRTMSVTGAFSAPLFDISPRVVGTGVYVQATGHSVSPIGGPVAGGTTITLSGIGLDLHGGTPTVLVDGVAATDVVVVDSSTIRAVTPARALPGTVDVIVRGPGPFEYRWPDGFSYAGVQSTERDEVGDGSGLASACASSKTGADAAGFALGALLAILALRPGRRYKRGRCLPPTNKSPR